MKNLILAAIGGQQIMLIVIVVLMIVALLVMPMITNKKRKKQIEELHSSIMVGDTVKTVGGIVGKVIEIRHYNTVHGLWSYFTADDGQIDLENGRFLVIGTLEAYEKFCKYFGNDVVLPIYIDVEDGIRLERALIREKKQDNPRYKELCRRFIADSEDFSDEKLAKAGVERRFYNNGTIEECIQEICEAITANM